jgi:hypothetical protein
LPHKDIRVRCRIGARRSGPVLNCKTFTRDVRVEVPTRGNGTIQLESRKRSSIRLTAGRCKDRLVRQHYERPHDDIECFIPGIERLNASVQFVRRASGCTWTHVPVTRPEPHRSAPRCRPRRSPHA